MKRLSSSPVVVITVQTRLLVVQNQQKRSAILYWDSTSFLLAARGLTCYIRLNFTEALTIKSF